MKKKLICQRFDIGMRYCVRKRWPCSCL